MSKGCLVIGLAVALAFGLAAGCLAQADNAVPDVLVLILSGMGPWDQVSISYPKEVPVGEVRADLSRLARENRWIIRDQHASVETSAAPGSKPSTSLSFRMPRIVNADTGVLPIEPFIVALKRFDHVEIDYLLTSPFTFRGLKDFSDQHVNIELRQSGGSYRYRVRIRNNDFKHLGLPLTQVAETKQREAPMPVATRMILIVGLALVAAIVAFLVAAQVSKRRSG